MVTKDARPSNNEIDQNWAPLFADMPHREQCRAPKTWSLRHRTAMQQPAAGCGPATSVGLTHRESANINDTWYYLVPAQPLSYVLHFSWFFWGTVFFSCISYQAALLATAPTAAPCERCCRIAPAWRPLPRQQGLPVPAPVKADETWALSDPRRDEIDVKPLSMVFLAFHCLLC